MSTIKENLKEVLIFDHQKGSDLYFKKTLMTKHEWDNNLNKNKFAVLNFEGKKERVIEIVESEIKKVEDILEKMNETFNELTRFQKMIIEKNKFNLLFLPKSKLKNVKKYIVRKRYLEKKLKKLKMINSDSELVIINESSYDDNYQVFNRGKEIDKDENLGKYFVSKVVNSDNEFKVYFLIEEKDVIPKKVISVSDNKVHLVLAIDKHTGSEEYTDLIDINKIMPDGTVIGTKFVAFKNKDDLIDFLGNVNKGLNESYFSAIKSLG